LQRTNRLSLALGGGLITAWGGLSHSREGHSSTKHQCQSDHHNDALHRCHPSSMGRRKGVSDPRPVS
jgi:hypothetical protein